MAGTEKISEADRMEQGGLERAIADVERQQLSLPPGTRPFFNVFLQNAKARLGFLEKKIHDAEREEREHASNEIVLASLASKEAALSEKEKETYSGFLKEDFFTKRDFARLDDFYAHSWDRLSEGGKQQMSHRVWEGIRRDEYNFSELPKSVREKEEKQAYKVLGGSSMHVDSATGIPEKDRNDFIRAYESGKHDEADKILERKSFKEIMFRDARSPAIRDAAVDQSKAADSVAMTVKITADTPNAVKESAESAAPQPGNLDLSSITLGGMKPADNPSQGAVASLPRTHGVSGREC